MHVDCAVYAREPYRAACKEPQSERKEQGSKHAERDVIMGPKKSRKRKQAFPYSFDAVSRLLQHHNALLRLL